MRTLVALALLVLLGCNKLLGVTDPVNGNGPDDARRMDAEIDSSIDAPPPCTNPTTFGVEASITVDATRTGLSFAVAKLDAGATQDVIVALGTDTVILHGDGTGGFANPLLLGSVSGQVLVDDFDLQDVKKDLILVAVGGTSVVERRQGATAGTFLAEQPLDGPFTNVHRAAIGQLDGNLVSDLLIEDDNERRIWTSNQGTVGTFTRENTTIGSAGDEIVAILDVDQTGRDDTILVDQTGNVKISLGSAATPTVIGSGATKHGIAFGKFNNDSFIDMIVATSAGGVIYLQDSASPGTFKQQPGLVSMVIGNTLHVLDVNGDGTDDIVTPTRVVLQCPGTPGVFTQVESVFSGDVAQLVDINGNGKPDLLRLEDNQLKVRLQ